MNQKGFQELYDKFKDSITDEEIRRQFDELNSISKDNDVLLVTVVGSLKAGKSTFFNCIINEEQDISETKPEECTIRPNFVIPSDKFAFRTYENINNVNIDINEVLNFLCGKKNNTIETDLNVRTKNEKNKLDDYVLDCQSDSKSYLFTSFSLNSNTNFVKKLKGKKVAFVDMPGSGGIDAEFNYKPFYDQILKRTDLVLLVCSSSVTISSALAKYLEFIQQNNPKVPFILVLNDRKDKFTKSASQEKLEQLENWKVELKKRNIIVVDTKILNAHLIHVALFKEELEDESDQHKVDQSKQKFDVFEDQFYSNFFTDDKIKTTVRDNQPARFQTQKENFENKLSAKIEELKTDTKDFENKVSQLIGYEKDSLVIDEEIENKITGSDDKSNVSADKDIKDERFWFRNKIRKKLIEYHEVVKSHVQEYVKEKCKSFDTEISKSVSDIFGIEIQVETNLSPLKQEFSKSRYNSCIEWKVFRYGKKEYSKARENLRTKAFAVEGYLQECFNKIKEEYIIELGKVTRHTKRSELLKTLQMLKTELSK